MSCWATCSIRRALERPRRATRLRAAPRWYFGPRRPSRRRARPVVELSQGLGRRRRGRADHPIAAKSERRCRAARARSRKPLRARAQVETRLMSRCSGQPLVLLEVLREALEQRLVVGEADARVTFWRGGAGSPAKTAAAVSGTSARPSPRRPWLHRYRKTRSLDPALHDVARPRSSAVRAASRYRRARCAGLGRADQTTGTTCSGLPARISFTTLVRSRS